MDEYKELNRLNRLQLMKIVLKLQKENRELEREKQILNEVIDETKNQLEELLRPANKDVEEYDWELKQQKEREHIS